MTNVINKLLIKKEKLTFIQYMSIGQIWEQNKTTNKF